MEVGQQNTRMESGSREEMFDIGDLGSFSMTTIYQALMNSGIACATDRQQDEHLNVGEEGEDSDCSWTQAEDNGEFYVDIRRRLDDLILAPDQTTMTTAVLSRRQRRFVHAMAQTMRLGHASLGAHGRNRRMVIFKHETRPVLAAEVQLEQSNSLEPYLDSEKREAPSPAESSPRKRQRIQKIHGGFPCQYEPCTKVFDRASERRKHEHTHQPALTNRYQCRMCNKGFRYPKDLRRHQKIHENPVDRGSLDLLSSSFGSSMLVTSTLSSESRVPSDISLNFSSKHASKENSPSLVPWAGECGTGIGIEPLVLGESSWAPSAFYVDESFQFPFEEFAGFGFDDNDGCDDGILEMARVRK